MVGGSRSGESLLVGLLWVATACLLLWLLGLHSGSGDRFVETAEVRAARESAMQEARGPRAQLAQAAAGLERARARQRALDAQDDAIFRTLVARCAEGLRSDDRATRFLAATDLAHMVAKRPALDLSPAREELIAALADPDEEVRDACVGVVRQSTSLALPLPPAPR